LVFLFSIFLIVNIALYPYLAEINYFKRMKNYENQKYEDAFNYFEKATRLDPYNGRILHALGSTYYQLDMQEEAQQILEKTKGIFNDRNTYLNLGLSYLQSGNIEAVVKNFKHAIYLDPEFWQAYNDLASLYVHQNEYEKAIEQWKTAINRNINFEEEYIFLYYIGMAYKRLDNQEKANDYFLEALKMAPKESVILKDIKKELLNIYHHKEESL